MQAPRHHHHDLLLVLVILGLLAATSTAAAQKTHYQDPNDQEADRLFQDGVAKMEAGLLEEGCTKLVESFGLDPKPGTLHALATCETRAGHLMTAYLLYERFLEQVNTMPIAQRQRYAARVRQIEQARKELQPAIPEVTFLLPPDAPWTTLVMLDGNSVDRGVIGKPYPIDPGEHVVTTQIPGSKSEENRFTIAKAEKKVVDLRVALPEKPPPPPPPPCPPPLPPPRACGCKAVGTNDGTRTIASLAFALTAIGLSRRQGGHRSRATNSPSSPPRR